MNYMQMPSPIGTLTLAGDEVGLRHIVLATEKLASTLPDDWQRAATLFGTAREQLEAYFAGERKTFDLVLAPQGTAFQRSVWFALADIPYGETVSYAEMARRVGRPTAARAVGAANGRNPLPIVLPCHRVIGADGSLVGYGGGLPIKQALLALEREHAGKE